MDFKHFSANFIRLNHWVLDDNGRYFIMTHPLRVWDGQTDKYTKFESLKEMWNFCFDGVHKVSDYFKDVESFDMVLEAKSRSSGGGTFKFGNAVNDNDGGGDETVISPKHFPAEANVRIKTKTEKNAINYFAKQYRNADHEYGYAIDGDGYVHNIKEGQRHSVGISGKKGQMIVHNHPSGSPAFSKGDMQVFARGPESGIIAIAKGGQMTVRKKGGHFRGAAFERAMQRARPKGKDYDSAISKWLKENQKKFGYTFEYKKRG